MNQIQYTHFVIAGIAVAASITLFFFFGKE